MSKPPPPHAACARVAATTLTINHKLDDVTGAQVGVGGVQLVCGRVTLVRGHVHGRDQVGCLLAAHPEVENYSVVRVLRAQDT